MLFSSCFASGELLLVLTIVNEVKEKQAKIYENGEN